MPPSNSSGATSLSSKTYTLTPLPSSSSSSSSRSARTARRIHVSAELLRACKISAGEPILIAPALSANELKKRLTIKQKKEEDHSEDKAEKVSERVRV